MRGVQSHIRILVWLLFCLLAWPPTSQAQDYGNVYTIKQGKMYIEVSKHTDSVAMEQYIARYELYDLPLRQFMNGQWTDSLRKLGWVVMKDNADRFAIAKSLDSFIDLENPVSKMLMGDPNLSGLFRIPVSGTALKYGVNKARKRNDFAISDSTVTFFLRQHQSAKQVLLAGSFTNWQYGALKMIRTDSGWISQVKLGPGKHWYKFIIDGDWATDKDNPEVENDGQGNMNSIYFKTNYEFSLPGFASARKVYVAGSFNGWDSKELAMIKTGNGWRLPVFLGEGTHTYRFVVDGEWMADPANPDRLPNEFHDFNSVVRLGKPVVFKLDGFAGAKKVVLSGNFNGWREDELFMQKTATGWVLPYTLGGGNYTYRFIIDGEWVSAPNHGIPGEGGNMFFVVQPNYTFRLRGYAQAKQVFLSGSFAEWSPATYHMRRDGSDWVIDMHLAPGKHLYKFVVDGQWVTDPDNKLWEQNEHGTGNSVLWMEEPATRARPVI